MLNKIIFQFLTILYLYESLCAALTLKYTMCLKLLKNRNGKPLYSTPNWDTYFSTPRDTKYQIVSDPSMENIAQSIIKKYPGRFYFHSTKWGKFPDGY
jgi:hypothetical protein